MSGLDAQDVAKVRRIVWSHYRKHGRHDLPWRKTTNPYCILVSEVMLQQTQVARVMPKYQAFLRQFPTVKKLAEAPLRDVFIVWQGLGYNRRAKLLREAARVMAERYNGMVPVEHTELVQLPGIGTYTAGAVCVFAHNQPVGMVETNIRTVLFHHYILSHRTEVADNELQELAEILCPKNDARKWYWALMDYGAYLKERGVRVNSKSKHYAKQSKFEGSDRQIRGAILKLLTKEYALKEDTIIEKVEAAPERIHAQLGRLRLDGLVARVNSQWSVPS